MASVERDELEPIDDVAVEAPPVDVDAVGVGARRVKRMNAAMLAEPMLRGFGAERVDG
jgi:hypothetical protein